MKKYSQLIDTVIENVSITNLVMETLETLIDSRDEVEQIMDDAEAMITFIRNITRKTFFQALPEVIQVDLTEVANFLAEATREKEFLSSNRLSVPENMGMRPELVTTETVAKTFEIALCRYLIFTSVFFNVATDIDAESYATVPEERKREIEDTLQDVYEFEPLKERKDEYINLTFEEYAKVHFVSYEDDIAESEREALGISDDSYATNVASFGDIELDM